MKKCTKCGEVKEVEAFCKNKRKKDGIHSQCKLCHKKYADSNREKIREYQKRYRDSNPEYQKKYADSNPDKIREYRKRYRDSNPDKIREYHKKRVDKLPDAYIKKELKRSGFTPTQIAENPELIELKRVIIKTNRFIKTKEQ